MTKMTSYMNQKLSSIIAVTLSAIPILMLIILLNQYAVNIPFWDQWDVIYLFDKYDRGDLTFSDFWAQHNEHRLVFPKLLFLLLGLISNYNVRYEIAMNVILALINYMVIIAHIHKNRSFYHFTYHHKILWVVCSAFIFSLIQWQNWMWGFQIQWFLCMTGVIVGAYIFSNDPINFKTIWLLFLCGILATFSLAGGMLYWIIIFLFLLFYAIKIKQKKMYQMVCIWGFLFIGVLIAYLNQYQKPEVHPSLLFFIDHPIQFIEYFLGYLGAPLAGDSLSDFNQEFIPAVFRAIAIGAVGVVTYLVFLFRHIVHSNHNDFQKSSFFLMLGLFSILSACLTALGRGGFGVRFALASRYTTISIGLWLSLFFIIFSYLINQNKETRSVTTGRRVIYYLALWGIFLSVILGSHLSIPLFRRMYFEREYLKDVILYEYNPVAFNEVHPKPQGLKEVEIPRLKRLRLSMFEHFPELSNDTVFLFPDSMWHYNTGWGIKGTFPNIQIDGDVKQSYFFTSCGVSPEKIGKIESSPVKIEKPAWVRLLVNIGHQITNQSIKIKIDGTPSVERSCDLNVENIPWVPCTFDLSPYIGRSFIIVAEDNSPQWKQCVGFLQPVMVYKR